MNKNKIGILIHGRHLQTKEWEQVVWGEPPHKLGPLPRAMLEVLIRGPENIAAIVAGTGASEKDGLKEAEYIKHYLCERLGELSEFTSIREHPFFQAKTGVDLLERLCSQIICETTSQNTQQEIAAAAKIFEKKQCTEIYQVTAGSHLPRTALDMLKARHSGVITAGQHWYLIEGDTTFAGTDISDVVVIEPPHRGDDPMVGAPVQLYEVIPKFYKIPQKNWVEITQRIKALFDEYLG